MMEESSKSSKSEKLSKLLKGKVVKSVLQFNDETLCLEFRDNTRLFVDSKSGKIDVSVT
jgi:hypothetical protein